MDDAYYYLSATLPSLEFDAKPPMSDEDYIQDCQRLLSDEDFAVYTIILSQQEELSGPNDTVNDIARYNQDFLNELVWFRTQRAHKEGGDAARMARSGSVSVIEAVGQASKEPNLLIAERILDKARWEAWDNFLMGKHNGLEYLIVYGLKLKILNRYNEINSPKGREVFEEIKNVEIPI